MTKWKRVVDSWKCSVILIAAISGCLFFLPEMRSIRQLMFAPADIQPQDFWNIQIQNADNEQAEIIFQPYSYEEQTFFQTLGERSCLLASINHHPLQVIFHGQSVKLHENDQIRLLWLVDPQLKSQLKSRVIPDQALVFTHGQLQEDVDHE